MPDESSGDRTEEATEFRKRKARERGQVAKSRDLAAAAVLLGGMVMLRFGWLEIYRWLAGSMQRFIGHDLGRIPAPTGLEILPHARLWLLYLAWAVAPFAIGCFLVALLINWLQVGFLFSTHPVTPDWNRINPARGLQRLVSARSAMGVAMNLGKIAIVLAVAWSVLGTVIPAAGVFASLEPGAMVAEGALRVSELGIKMAMTLFALGILDFGFQRWQMNRDLRMTKQEVKQELKEEVGDPQIRARRQQIQRQMAMQRMMAAVPESEVVIRNPTHYAVALRYAPEMAVPEVVAKGADHMALRIIRIARQHEVPVWQQPWLARQLYRLEVGDPIPAALFPAVAEVLAHVLKGERLAAYRRAMEEAA